MESEKPNIRFIIPWFGEFPWWMPYFVRSVEANNEYDWLLISDKKLNVNLPSNITNIILSIDNLKDLIADSTGVKPSFDNPYKLCDFKPAYGLIFSRFIKDFDYWGYCDIDMIFGDLSMFITPFLKNEIDVLSPDEEFFPGHFCIFRNKEEINNLYKLCPNHQQVFSSERVHMFDEFLVSRGVSNSVNTIAKAKKKKVKRHKLLSRLKELNSLQWLRKVRRNLIINSSAEYSDFNSVLKDKAKNSSLKIVQKQMYLSDVAFFREENTDWEIKWENGKLHYTKELLYFHFELSKQQNEFGIHKTQNGFKLSLK